MGILYYSYFKFFLSASAKAKMEFDLRSHIDCPGYGNISIAALYKWPVRFDGYSLFDRFLVAGLILYANQYR
jgi:hypothetical protein